MQQTKECCPEFDVSRWDKKELHWKGKTFVKDSVPAFFHFPFVPMIGYKIMKMWQQVEAVGAAADDTRDTLILFRDPGPFTSEIYIATEKEVPGLRNVHIDGEFNVRVYDGSNRDIPRFIREMDVYLEEKGKRADQRDYFVHYAYCPRCQKKYGHNYMAFFAKTE